MMAMHHAPQQAQLDHCAQVKRIVMRGTNWLGDAMMTTPALRRVRAVFPHAHLALIATERTAGLFHDTKLIDEVLLYRRREDGVRAFWAMVQTLRAGRFEAALLFQNAFEAALLAWLARVPVRVGYALHGRGALLTHALQHTASQRNRHQINDYLDIVAAAGTAFGCAAPTLAESDRTAFLPVTAAQQSAAQKLLGRFGLTAQPFIVLNAGATNSRAKCWPEASFAQLAERLHAATGADIVFIGAASERAAAARICAQLPSAVTAYNLAGETTLPALVGLLAQSDLLVSNDTGPAHVGAALGVPTLTIFGPTNEFETAPTGSQAALLRAENIACARCMHRDCPIDHRCMTQLTPTQVAAQALALLHANPFTVSGRPHA